MSVWKGPSDVRREKLQQGKSFPLLADLMTFKATAFWKGFDVCPLMVLKIVRGQESTVLETPTNTVYIDTMALDLRDLDE